MFSEKLQQYANQTFKESMQKLGEKTKIIKNYVNSLINDEQILMKFLYGTMPFSDAADYEPELFHQFVLHSLYLRQNRKETKALPEDIFLNYVLYYRINNEDIVNCRPWFYEKLKDRIKNKNEEESVIEINYWCAEHVAYGSTDARTMNPITLYYHGIGRCGEESVFLVSVLRSMGIAARQVYTPRWAHCNDNHAWVEAYVDRKWQFLGACEPEEYLNHGWFTNAVSRAILTQSRIFSEYISDDNVKKEKFTGKEGAVYLVSDTSVYTDTTNFLVKVLNTKGELEAGIEVRIEILNMAEFYPCAILYTDQMGQVSLEIGKGSVQIYASNQEGFVSSIINTAEKSNVTLQIKDFKQWEQETAVGQWEEIEIIAPLDFCKEEKTIAENQKKIGKNKKQTADMLRLKRLTEQKEAVIEKSEIAKEILEEAFGNQEEILHFLSGEAQKEKIELLQIMPKKDWMDLRADVFEEHFMEAKAIQNKTMSQFLDNSESAKKVFLYYVLNPRIRYEMIRPWRKEIKNWFIEKEKEMFYCNPKIIWYYILDHVKTTDSKIYDTVITTPMGVLTTGQGSELSMKTLFVAICRTFGIPARINAVNMDIEYYQKGEFYKVELQEKTELQAKEKEQSKKIPFILKCDKEQKPIYYENYTIGKLVKKGETYHFETQDYTEIQFMEGKLELLLEAGIYRILTTVRIPNGNQLVLRRQFQITEQAISFSLKFCQPKIEDMLEKIKLEPFSLKDDEENQKNIVEFIKGKKTVLLFLELGMEPTEHVLNEMLESEQLIKDQNWNLLFVVQEKKEEKNKTFTTVLEHFSNIQVFYDDFTELPEKLARRMYVNPEKLPLMLVMTENMVGHYASSGYQTGVIKLISLLIPLI